MTSEIVPWRSARCLALFDPQHQQFGSMPLTRGEQFTWDWSVLLRFRIERTNGKLERLHARVIACVCRGATVIWWSLWFLPSPCMPCELLPPVFSNICLVLFLPESYDRFKLQTRSLSSPSFNGIVIGCCDELLVRKYSNSSKNNRESPKTNTDMYCTYYGTRLITVLFCSSFDVQGAEWMLRRGSLPSGECTQSSIVVSWEANFLYTQSHRSLNRNKSCRAFRFCDKELHDLKHEMPALFTGIVGQFPQDAGTVGVLRQPAGIGCVNCETVL